MLIVLGIFFNRNGAFIDVLHFTSNVGSHLKFSNLKKVASNTLLHLPSKLSGMRVTTVRQHFKRNHPDKLHLSQLEQYKALLKSTNLLIFI